MNTPFVQIYFKLVTPAEKLNPHVLFAIKQHFPAALRRVTGCLTSDLGCSAGPACPCRAVFDQTLTSDPAALRRYQKPPLPFAFKIPVLPGTRPERKGVELALVIAGDAISQLGLFIKAVRFILASSGCFNNWSITAVEAASGDGTRVTLPAEIVGDEFSSLPLLSFDELFSHECAACSQLTINFLTPVRLIHKGLPLRELPFPAVAGALFRRISSLAYYYGQEELPHDFKWLAERSREISCVSTELSWVNRGGGLQGVEGAVTYRGDLTDFNPFLSLGSRLNIGKGATYGMGSYSFSAG